MTSAEKTFSDIMDRLLPEPCTAIAVAVSGGGDSLALTLMLQKWTKARGISLIALTVDHGLRPESKIEAEKLGIFLSARGIPYKILSWAGEKPKTHVQEMARQARYRLLVGACRAENISTLALAHNLEDQVETFWMRLAHGSGLDGLSGMAAARDVEGIQMIRPVLSFSRQELRDFCRAEGAAYIDDPSNQDEKYLRVRLRGFEDMLAAEGFTPQRLVQTMRKLSESRGAIEWMEDKAYADCVQALPDGITLNHEKFLGYPAAIRKRLLSRMILSLNHQDYAPGAEALAQLEENLQLSDFAGRTLGGCIFGKLKRGQVMICREEQNQRLG
jgi:tRNA(Ile)-lysidine synthase